jgi:hypothetical protein
MGVSLGLGRVMTTRLKHGPRLRAARDEAWRDTLHELYESASRRGRRFRYGLLAFDLVTLVFVVATSFPTMALRTRNSGYCDFLQCCDMWRTVWRILALPDENILVAAVHSLDCRRKTMVHLIKEFSALFLPLSSFTVVR